MELLDAIMTVTKCERVEQLRELTPERRERLAESIEVRVPSGLATLEEWNEVLTLFTNIPPEASQKEAKQKLIRYLRGDRSDG